MDHCSLPLSGEQLPDFAEVGIDWTWTPPGWICTYEDLRGVVIEERRVEVWQVP
jgi:hypothetical protein